MTVFVEETMPPRLLSTDPSIPSPWGKYIHHDPDLGANLGGGIKGIQENTRGNKYKTFVSIDIDRSKMADGGRMAQRCAAL